MTDWRRRGIRLREIISFAQRRLDTPGIVALF
jgi:hypothetical protein